jgi:hypothetical protein
MKRRQAISGLLGVLVLASAVGAPQATAQDCRWIAHDLPLPPGVAGGQTVASSGDNSLILGSVWQNGSRGVVWWNGQLWPMDPPESSSTSVVPKDINNSSLVVGRQEFSSGDYRAFRFQYGKYDFLPTEPGEQSQAIAVNDAGDVVGEVWQKSAPDVRTAVMWPVNQPRKSFGQANVHAITADRKVVISTGFGTAVAVVDADTGGRTDLPGARTPMVLDNDRILHFTFTAAGTELVELGLDGQRIASYEGGIEPYGKTSGGVVFGTTGPGNTTLWQWGGRHNVDSEKLPKPQYYGDVTDGGALIGTYADAQQQPHPARWFWCA